MSRANGWDAPAAAAPHYPPIEHVLYIIKENRTYDQVLGDERQGDGDTSLVFFPRAITPNIHALAERFGLYDRFFVNAEVSTQGHDWSTAAYVTDYREKTTPADYADKRHATDESDEGDDPAEPANGLPVEPGPAGRASPIATTASTWFRRRGPVRPTTAAKPYLASHSHPTFPAFDMEIPDQHRADLWLEELQAVMASGAIAGAGNHVAAARSHRRRHVPAQHAPRDGRRQRLAVGRMVDGRIPFAASGGTR